MATRIRAPTQQQQQLVSNLKSGQQTTTVGGRVTIPKDWVKTVGGGGGGTITAARSASIAKQQEAVEAKRLEEIKQKQEVQNRLEAQREAQIQQGRILAARRGQERRAEVREGNLYIPTQRGDITISGSTEARQVREPTFKESFFERSLIETEKVRKQPLTKTELFFAGASSAFIGDILLTKDVTKKVFTQSPTKTFKSIISSAKEIPRNTVEFVATARQEPLFTSGRFLGDVLFFGGAGKALKVGTKGVTSSAKGLETLAGKIPKDSPVVKTLAGSYDLTGFVKRTKVFSVVAKEGRLAKNIKPISDILKTEGRLGNIRILAKTTKGASPDIFGVTNRFKSITKEIKVIPTSLNRLREVVPKDILGVSNRLRVVRSLSKMKPSYPADVLGVGKRFKSIVELRKTRIRYKGDVLGVGKRLKEVRMLRGGIEGRDLIITDTYKNLFRTSRRIGRIGDDYVSPSIFKIDILGLEKRLININKMGLEAPKLSGDILGIGRRFRSSLIKKSKVKEFIITQKTDTIQKIALQRFYDRQSVLRPIKDDIRNIALQRFKESRSIEPVKRFRIAKFEEPEIPKGYQAQESRNGQILLVKQKQLTRQIEKPKIASTQIYKPLSIQKSNFVVLSLSALSTSQKQLTRQKTSQKQLQNQRLKVELINKLSLPSISISAQTQRLKSIERQKLRTEQKFNVKKFFPKIIREIKIPRTKRKKRLKTKGTEDYGISEGFVARTLGLKPINIKASDVPKLEKYSTIGIRRTPIIR